MSPKRKIKLELRHLDIKLRYIKKDLYEMDTDHRNLLINKLVSGIKEHTRVIREILDDDNI